MNRSLVMNIDTTYGSLVCDKSKCLYLEPCFSVFSFVTALATSSSPESPSNRVPGLAWHTSRRVLSIKNEYTPSTTLKPISDPY